MRHKRAAIDLTKLRKDEVDSKPAIGASDQGLSQVVAQGRINSALRDLRGRGKIGKVFR